MKALANWLGIGALLLASGCVPETAGYDDVRQITSARLQKDVHWHEHSSRRTTETQTDKLLDKPLTADSTVQIALLNNEAFQAAFETLGIARAELAHAVRLPNPHVGAGLRYGAEDGPEIELDATLSLSELLFLPWRNGAGQAALDAAKLEVARSAVNLAFETQRAFFDYQAATQGLELRRTVLQSLRASFDMAEKLHAAGNITDLDLASERALYEEARIGYARAEAEALAQREKLNEHLGLWGERAARWQASPRLATATPVAPLLSELERRVLTRSLDLELSKKRFEAAAKRANLARIEGWVPELRAGISAERGEDGWLIGPVAELEVPLFYQGQGEAAVALAEMRREQNLHNHTAVRLRSRARAVASRLSATTESVRYYETTVLPLRDQVVRETQLQYNAMSVGVFQLLQAQRDQVAAAETYVSLLHDYWSQRTELEQLLAGGLPTSSAGSMTTALPTGGSAQANGH